MKTGPHALIVLVLCGLALTGCDAEKPTATLPGTPDGNMQAVVNGIIDGDPSVVFAAMPDSYQKDVNDLVHRFAGKMDAEVYDKLFVIVGKAGTVMRDKKSFLVNAKSLKENPEVDLAQLDANWDSIVGIFDVIANSDAGKLSSLKTLDVMKFLQGDGSKILKKAQAIAALKKGENPFEAMKKIKVELMKSEGDSATLKMTDPDGRVKEEQFNKVEGKWIPTEMAEEWAEKMAEARSGIESLDTAKLKAQMMPMLAAVEANIDLLAQAKTQEEFEQTAESMGKQVMMAVIGMMMQMQQGAEEAPMPMPMPMPE